MDVLPIDFIQTAGHRWDGGARLRMHVSSLKFCLSDVKLRFLGWKKKKSSPNHKIKVKHMDSNTPFMDLILFFACFEKVSESFRLFLIVRIPRRECTDTHALTHNLLPTYDVIHEVLKVHGGVIRGEISVCA